jgi:hypothetical protein
MPVELPPPARQFLRTSDGRRARRIVYAFHHWLAQRQLTVDKLTADHFEQLFAHLQEQHGLVGERRRRRGDRQWLTW